MTPATDQPTAQPCTTIARLLYPKLPDLDFARLVADLDGALSARASPERNLTWDHEDVAILDFGSSRVALSLADGLGGDAPAAITVTVGYGPATGLDARLAQRQSMLARLIADRIAGRFTPLRVVWSESDAMATPELLDILNEPAAVLDSPASKPGPMPARPRRVSRFAEPSDLQPILARLEATLAARRAGQPEPVAGAANDSPDLPRQPLSSLASVRSALYAGPEDLKVAPSPIIRLAAYTLDATLMVVALPVGAAMMTYSLGRGANLQESARMLALCGIGIGALQSMGGTAGFMSLIRSMI